MKRIKWLLALIFLFVINIPNVYAEGLEYYLTMKKVIAHQQMLKEKVLLMFWQLLMEMKIIIH